MVALLNVPDPLVDQRVEVGLIAPPEVSDIVALPNMYESPSHTSASPPALTTAFLETEKLTVSKTEFVQAPCGVAVRVSVTAPTVKSLGPGV